MPVLPLSLQERMPIVLAVLVFGGQRPPPPLPPLRLPSFSVAYRDTVNKLNSEIGMVAVVRAIASAMGLPKPSAAEVPARVIENSVA